MIELKVKKNQGFYRLFIRYIFRKTTGGSQIDPSDVLGSKFSENNLYIATLVLRINLFINNQFSQLICNCRSSALQLQATV